VADDNRNYSDFFYMGFMFPACIVVGAGFGYFADQRWHHIDPWGKIIGFLVGTVAGFYNFYQSYQALQRKKNESGKD